MSQNLVLYKDIYCCKVFWNALANLRPCDYYVRLLIHSLIQYFLVQIKENMMDPQWIIAFASSFAALGIIGVAIQCRTAISQLTVSSNQLKTSIDQLKADHERSRRERAVELLSQWDNSLTRNAAMARKFSETLSFEQSKSLFKQQSFEVNNNSHYQLFLGALPIHLAKLREQTEAPETIKINERESSEIRWAIITYLNQLESTLTAVRHNVADKEMIYEQFEFLVAPSDGHYVLEDFRTAAGGATSYPSIEAFANELKEKHSTPPAGKLKVA